MKIQTPAEKRSGGSFKRIPLARHFFPILQFLCLLHLTSIKFFMSVLHSRHRPRVSISQSIPLPTYVAPNNPEDIMISPEKPSLDQRYDNNGYTRSHQHAPPPPHNSRMQEIRHHQQLERQLRRNIHIRHVLRITVLLVVIKVLADLLQDHRAVCMFQSARSTGESADLLHVLEDDLVLAGFGKVACRVVSRARSCGGRGRGRRESGTNSAYRACS